MAKYFKDSIQPANGDYYCKVDQGRTFGWFHGQSDEPEWEELDEVTGTMRPFLDGTETQFIARIREDDSRMQREAGRNAS